MSIINFLLKQDEIQVEAISNNGIIEYVEIPIKAPSLEEKASKLVSVKKIENELGILTGYEIEETNGNIAFYPYSIELEKVLNLLPIKILPFKTDEELLIETKSKKIQEIENHWYELRKFRVVNSLTLEIVANQEWSDTIINTLDILRGDGTKTQEEIFSTFFEYQIIGTAKKIKIPYLLLFKLKNIVATLRSYCRTNADNHIAKINSYKSKAYVENYDYTIDLNTRQKALPIEDINIDSYLKI